MCFVCTKNNSTTCILLTNNFPKRVHSQNAPKHSLCVTKKIINGIKKRFKPKKNIKMKNNEVDSTNKVCEQETGKKENGKSIRSWKTRANGIFLNGKRRTHAVKSKLNVCQQQIYHMWENRAELGTAEREREIAWERKCWDEEHTKFTGTSFSSRKFICMSNENHCHNRECLHDSMYPEWI